ncbi:hypothetical protein [Marivirga sp.]|uniref:hypothetical protein n=1 Tax=Marivirga sp. TaxID=2018662 RepID=UPI003DA77591
MKQITLNIPDNKYTFFMELVKNLGIEKVKNPSMKENDGTKKKKASMNKISSLRGKLQLNEKQLNDFHQHVKNSREEWNRDA